MNLGELISELRDNILHDRSDRVSGSSDYLWDDATLVRYINEAQRRFARKSFCLRDAQTDDVCKFTLKAGQDEYTLHPSIIAVISARTPPLTRDLARVGHSILSGFRQSENAWFDPNNDTLPPGRPIAFSTDEGMGLDDNDSSGVVVMRIFPVPDQSWDGQEIRLRVVRTPIEPLILSSKTSVPEIPEGHHLEMLDWAAYLALRIVDHDAGNPQRAGEFRQSFEDAALTAKKDAMRKMFAPQPWGFGRNGWSWES